MNVVKVMDTLQKVSAKNDQAKTNADGDFMNQLDKAVESTRTQNVSSGPAKSEAPKSDTLTDAVKDAVKDAVTETIKDAAKEAEASMDVPKAPEGEEVQMEAEQPAEEEELTNVVPALIPSLFIEQDVEIAVEADAAKAVDAAAPVMEGDEALVDELLKSVQENTAKTPAAQEETAEAKAQQPVVELELPEQPEAKTQQPAKTDANAIEVEFPKGEGADFAAQVLSEADEMIANEAKPEAKQQAAGTQNEIVADADKGETQVRTVAAADEDGETKNETQTQPKESIVKPATAAVQTDGRVDFKAAVAAQAEAPQAMEVPKSPAGMQFVQQVQTMVSQEKSEFYLQLKPENLGGLSILLSAEGDGIVAKLATASKQVQYMLQADMTAIQQELREKGINVVQMEVIYDQMPNMMAHKDSDSQQQGKNTNTASKVQGRTEDIIDEMTFVYDTLTNYEVLTEQGGSVEFSA